MLVLISSFLLSPRDKPCLTEVVVSNILEDIWIQSFFFSCYSDSVISFLYIPGLPWPQVSWVFPISIAKSCTNWSSVNAG